MEERKLLAVLCTLWILFTLSTIGYFLDGENIFHKIGKCIQVGFWVITTLVSSWGLFLIFSDKIGERDEDNK